MESPMKKFTLLFCLIVSYSLVQANDEFFMKDRNDPVKIEAFAKAKEHQGIFIEALENRGLETSKYDYYGAYLKFEENGQTEYLWLGDVQKYKEFYIGVILSEPRLLTNTKSGKTIGFYPSDIYDWQLSEKQSGKIIGAFYICANSDKGYIESQNFACNL